MSIWIRIMGCIAVVPLTGLGVAMTHRNGIAHPDSFGLGIGAALLAAAWVIYVTTVRSK